MRCRLCSGEVKKFLNLGETPLPEEFRTKHELDKEVKHYPLNLVYCTKCLHVQLGFKISADVIYKKNYFYDYSVTKTGSEHWYKLSKKIYKDYKLSTNDLVVDIGSNTGVLLSFFKSQGSQIVGIDPATRQVNIARKIGIPTICSYFSPKVAQRIVRKYGQAKVITCNNTFDHVWDLDELMKGVTLLLKQGGVLIIEVPYFINMLKNLNHIVYHQQIDYISLSPLMPFFNRFGLEIVDCQPIPMHGGSIRIYARFKGQNGSTKRLLKLLDKENKLIKNWPSRLILFAQKILKQKDELVLLLKNLKKDGQRVAAVGASAKGITLLNYSHLDPQTIEFITEKSPLKIGRFTPSKIPIVPDSKLYEQKIDYALLLSWNFQEEIIRNLSKYKKLGGKFIIPIPKLKII